ncbi:helix-turn-helix transcriptional regulator [Actinokineospora sp. UTMC 2448]|uniref:helix-turn-helix domain-containing protein n=1 Tax=Actinokineospora sp. UTMC 2448 TaxID=2268449 RepID=UPI002164E05F|nr:helix-turn-helix transcriptional regulator [Actinokineospora sp. UTMC 2448]UVS81807.1 BetR domain protein [Actinokineospora sp. UTMC 2448]
MTSVLPLPDRPPADSLSAQVAEEVRALLARRRTTANKVRQQLGWTQSYISRRMNGTTPFDVEDLAQLAALFQVPVTDFFPASKRPPLAKVTDVNRD